VPPTASEILASWERGLGAPAGRRALGLTALARPELDDAELETLPVGERDAALLDLRERLFGPAVDAVVSCPRCGEVLELAPAAEDLRAAAAAGVAGEHTLVHGGYELRFRLPTAGDLADVADEPELERARDELLARCVLEARVDGRAVSAPELPADVVEALELALAEAGPLADLELSVECPACGHESTTPFDVAAFLWAELERHALGIVREIHVLAWAYGWSESEILALGPRRRLYLELVEG
jgi:hypothetical protein